jgi:hypothetical protein
VTHDMENLRKKNETEVQSAMEGHSSWLEQAELEDEREIKGKTEELLVKQLKPVKGIYNNSPNPSKDQTWDSQTLKKRCKQKEFVIDSTK